jgi:ankyrin repeat protein
MATRAAKYREHVEDVLKIATGLALSGYGEAVGQMTGMARAFRSDVPLWAVHKAHRGPLGRTRLMFAAWKGDVERARFLVERGAAVDELDKNSNPALWYACFDGRLDALRFLVERGGAAVNAARATDGVTALMCASQEGHLEIVRYLVERGGAAVNAARTDDGATTLHAASFNGHLEVMRYLLVQQGVPADAARTADGETALMWASVEGHLATVRLLLQHGADKGLLNHAGQTARDLAARHPLVQAALA